MAPVAPLGKKGLLRLLERGMLPVTFGSPHPFLSVVAQDGVFRLRELVVDPVEEKAAREKSFAQGHGWMPEHHYALGRPTGQVHLEAKTLEDLQQQIEKLDWPRNW